MEGLIAQLKEEDSKINKNMRHIVPVPHGTDTQGPISYEHRRDPELLDKMNYGNILTGKDVQPVVTVTDEDVKVMDEKAWMARLKDFNQWVGHYYKPEANPANKELLSKIYPQWIEMQKKEIDDWHDFKKRYETVKLRGPDGVEDLFLLYNMGWPTEDNAELKDPNLKRAMETEMAPRMLSKEELKNKEKTWAKDDRDNFYRGVFNSRRLYMQTQAMGKVVGYKSGYNRERISTDITGYEPAKLLEAGFHWQQ